MKRTLLIIRLSLLVSVPSFVGCMTNHGIGTPPGGGVSLGGDGVYSAAGSKTDSSAPDSTSDAGTDAAAGPSAIDGATYRSKTSPAVAAAGSSSTDSSAGSHPAFGPDVMAPMSDSETTGGGKDYSKAVTPKTAPACDSLPTSLDFRIITGFQEPNLQDSGEPLPMSLDVAPKFNDTLSWTGNGLFLVQAFAAFKNFDGTPIPVRWYDIVCGPTVRMVIQRDGQDVADAKYVDLPVAYFGMKDIGRGSNLNIEFPLTFPFWAGDTVSLYLYYDLNKPPSDAKEFFADKIRVHFLGSFPITLAAYMKAPLPPDKPKDKSGEEPKYVISPGFHVHAPTVWDILVKIVFYTKIDYIDPSGKTETGSDFNIYGTPLPLPSDPKSTPSNLLFTAQYATLDHCDGSECWPWKPIDDGHFVRMLVERQVGYDSIRLNQDIKLAASGGTGNLNIPLSPDVPLKDGDILDFYYSRPGGKPASDSPVLSEVKKNAYGNYDDDPFYQKALFLGRFQVQVGLKLQKMDGYRPPDIPLVSPK